jgi:pyruvate/2-oxoglutarate dehydrogenase complex dihydrolipoamide dehydrogenase (E3) component
MESFDLVVIGGGAAGLVTASGAAQLGAKVALIERGRLGGECLWTGCVPSKALIEAARTKVALDRAGGEGFILGGVKVDFSGVMDRVHRTIMAIQPHDDPKRFRDMGVDVIEGTARFTGPDRVTVNGRVLVSRRFCVATGGDPLVPPIDGIQTVPYSTHENFFDIRKQPEHLIIIGGGPIGCELGQAMRRLGSRVTIIETLDGILHRDDRELACELHSILESEGVVIHVGARAEKAGEKDGRITLTVRGSSGSFDVEGDALLLATGKRPRTSDLGLEAAGVAVEKTGIRVDAGLRTTNPRVYACGDVAGPYLFTHLAEYQAGVVVGNALIPMVNRRADYRVVPWVTYTDPELAHVGWSEAEAKQRLGPDAVKVHRYELAQNDRHIIEGKTRGAVKVTARPNGKILGCDMLGANAGELIHEYALALRKKLGVQDISRTIHAYPTLAQANKRASDRYYAEKIFQGRLPGWVRWWLGKTRPKVSKGRD